MAGKEDIQDALAGINDIACNAKTVEMNIRKKELLYVVAEDSPEVKRFVC